MKDKQTAIDWILKEINERGGFIFTIHYEEVFAQAKQMEKEQIMNAIERYYPYSGRKIAAEKYYNENYGE
jgi:hypothetical protein